MSQPDYYGRYGVKKVLGRGAMGVVYLAEDPVIGREVAIKVIHAHASLEEQELQQLQARFEREFRSAGTLSHPNIVTIHDVGQEDGSSFIAMEFVRGEALDSVIASNRVLTFKEVSDLILQVCDGLDFAHDRGVIHRDIKPANIIITREGRPKITDFGIAKLTTTTLTRTGTVIGTPSYMSPEQVTGHPVTGASDQFSVAVMVYQMLTGERPFSGDSPTTIMYKIVHEEPVRPKVLNARLPEGLDRALMRALDKDPAQRYPTCIAFAEAMRDALGAAPAAATVALSDPGAETIVAIDSAEPERPGEDAAVALSRVPMIAGIAAAAVIVAALSLWTVMGGNGDEPPPPDDFVVEVVSQPPGATIMVNGVDRGLVTPSQVTLQGNAGDSVLLELVRDGNLMASKEVVLGDPLDAVWNADVTGTEDDEEEPDPVPVPVPETYIITSQPAGAQVYMDGELQEGATPLEIQILPGQRYEVRVEMDEYLTASWAFTDDDLSETHRSTGELFFNLESLEPPGTLALSGAPYPVAITARRLNDAGNPTGWARSFEAAENHLVELAAGVYQVELSAPSVYFDSTDRVSIQSEVSQQLVVPRAVNVRVIAYPENCRVSIDGRFHDSTPFGVALVVGDHDFHFDWGAVGEGQKTVTRTITREGQQIREQPGQQ